MALAVDLRERGELDLTECFIDGTFVAAKKGASMWEYLSGAKARSSWRWQTALVFHSPSTQALLRRMKSPLVEDTLAENLTDEPPQRLIGDKAYDSDPLDKRLAAAGIEMIVPHKHKLPSRLPHKMAGHCGATGGAGR
jgi:hypothetical protein